MRLLTLANIREALGERRGEKKRRKDLGGEIKTSRGAAGVCDAATLGGGGDFHLIMFSES